MLPGRAACASFPPRMKLLLTSDPHQRIEKWRDLVAAVRAERPRFVLVAGDLLPKGVGFRGQRDFFPELRAHLEAMRQAAPVTVLTYLGNDDAHILEPALEELEAAGLCRNLNGRVHREAGLVFCGMNRVRDYPFGYKHWCAPDGDFIACPQQFCGEGLDMDAQGNFIPLESLVAHLSAKPCLGEELDRLARQLQPGEMARSVWMVHQPPSDLGMDLCGSGARAGSPTVREFIEQRQPLLGCSGHIHESPYQPGGQWLARVGRTVWVQPGQMGDRLHHVRVRLSEALTVTEIEHSVFGAGGAR